VRRALASPAFAPVALPADSTGAQACSTANATVSAAAQQVSAADIAALGDSLTTALSSGSTDALLSVVRQLSAASNATASSGADAVSAAAEQAVSAMGAMADLVGTDGMSVDESLGVADAGASLMASGMPAGQHSNWPGCVLRFAKGACPLPAGLQPAAS
jgi:hypothetical protein